MVKDAAQLVQFHAPLAFLLLGYVAGLPREAAACSRFKFPILQHSCLLCKLFHWQCSLSPYPTFPNGEAMGASCDWHSGFQLPQTKLQTLCLKAHPKMMGQFNSSVASDQRSSAACLTVMWFNCSDVSLITKPMPRNCSWNKSWPKASFPRIFTLNLWLPGATQTLLGHRGGCSHPELLQHLPQPHVMRYLTPNFTLCNGHVLLQHHPLKLGIIPE